METYELLKSLYWITKLEHKLLKAWKDGLDPKDFIAEFDLLERLLRTLSRHRFYQTESNKPFDIN